MGELCMPCSLGGVVNLVLLPRHTTVHLSLVFEYILCVVKHRTKINQFSFRSLIPPPYKTQSCPADAAVAVVTVIAQSLWFESVVTTSGDKHRTRNGLSSRGLITYCFTPEQ